MAGYDKVDASKDTGDSTSKVSEAQHDSRNDAEKAGIFERGNDSKNKERFSKTDDSGQRAESLWDSIFGKK